MLYHRCFASAFGELRLDWRDTPTGPRVMRIWLPGMLAPPLVESAVGEHPVMLTLIEQLQAFLTGEAHTFALEQLALDTCSPFQAQVLRAEHGIPRGQVSTYQRLATHLGVSGGARAVGNALARNPFPLLIPCHRAVATDGGLGGFQGGLTMKRRLLEMEGIQFSAMGKVVGATYYY